MTLAKAINAGPAQAMLADDPKVLLMGEDIGTLGGVFRVTEGLQAEFGDKRVLDTPLAESGIVGTAIGLAMRGYRPVCEIQFDGFIYPGFDQITSQLAKLTYRHEGSQTFPVVIRVPYGGHIGAVEHHQESPEAYFAHTAGPARGQPVDPARRLLDDPGGDRRATTRCMFFEPKSRYWPKGEVDLARQRRRRCTPAASCARAPRSPSSATARWSRCCCRRPRSRPRRAPASRSSTCARSRRSTTTRSSRPCRRPAGSSSRRRRPATSASAPRSPRPIAERAFYSLEAPVLRVSGFDTPFPPAKLEAVYLPDADRVLEAVDRALAY